MLYLFLAEGFEETEAVATADMLRRAGLDLCVCSVQDELTVHGAHGIPVRADKIIGECDFSDLCGVVLPGGMPGVTNLAACAKLKDIISSAASEGKLIAAICAAPTILSAMGLIKGRRATVYPSMKNELISGGADYKETPQIDGNIITANGPASAIEFGLMIVDYICGGDIAADIKKSL